MRHLNVAFFSITALLAAVIGCAHDGAIVGLGPSAPDLADFNTSECGHDRAGRALWGEWLIALEGGDRETSPEATVKPLRRTEAYQDVTSSCILKVEVADFAFGPGPEWTTWTLKVTLTNPLSLTAYDVWGILYPPSDLAYVPYDNQDGLTTLFNAGMPDEYNPYKAFAAEEERRAFSGHATHSVWYVIRKHWSYPFVQMVFRVTAGCPDNARVPVGSYVQQVGKVHPEGTSAFIRAILLDWQDDISRVELDLSNYGVPGMMEMAKTSESESEHTSTWDYLLPQAGGYPAGERICRLFAHDSIDTLIYARDFAIRITYDSDPPRWTDPGCVGIYDRISGPNLTRLFFCEATDVSLPLEYIFYRDEVPGCFGGEKAKVVLSSGYVGYADFNQVPSKHWWYGITLKDAQGNKGGESECYECVSFAPHLRWRNPGPTKPDFYLGVDNGPVLGDVNGDGADEIVVGDRSGTVYVWRGYGEGESNTLLWKFDVGGAIHACPAVADLNADGKGDVIVGGADCYVHAVSGEGDEELWTAACDEEEHHFNEAHGTPAIAQLNGGANDVVIGTDNGTLFALNGEDGSEIWRYNAGGAIKGAPGVADVTGEGIPDVCVGALGHRVHMVSGANGKRLWAYDTGQGPSNVCSSPAMVDINEDEVPDCVFGAWIGSGRSALYALDGMTGSEIWVLDGFTGNLSTDPAPCHLNDDGVWDFIVTCQDAGIYSYYAVDGARGEIIYQELVPGVDPETQMTYSSPIACDLTGDGHLNVCFGVDNGMILIYNAGDFDLPGKQEGLPLWIYQIQDGESSEITGSPAVGDVDGDGSWELVFADRRGRAYVVELWSPAPTEPLLTPWLQKHGNRWHTGVPNFIPPD